MTAMTTNNTRPMTQTKTEKDARFWDKIAEKYATDAIADMDNYILTRERTRALLKDTDRVLEVGCGTGSTALELAESVAHIEGTDISPAMIDIARRKANEAGVTNAEFNVATVSETRTGEKGFDAALAHNILHLVPDLRSGLRDIATAVKPGGLFISKTPCLGADGFSPKSLFFRVMVGGMKLVGKAPSVLFFSPSELDDAIRSAGFEIVSSEAVPAPNGRRYIVARKL